MNVFGHVISLPQLYGQLLIGLINGSFYALLSLGLAVIFGMLSIVNFAHGAFYMMGAFGAYFLMTGAGLGYWWALLLSPILIGAVGAIVERLFLKRLAGFDPLYSLLLTFGLALIFQGLFQNYFGASGMPYAIPKQLSGAYNLGFMFLPVYRGWVILASMVVCFGTWLAIEKTKLGAYLRAATENPTMVRAFGINVPRMVTLTYAFGVALAAFAGVLAAPINQVRPGMGADIIAVVFAVVVIGGDARDDLTEFIRSKQFTPNTMLAMRTLVNDIGTETSIYKELRNVPNDRVRNFRNDLYLVSEVLRITAKTGQPKFSASDAAVLANYKKHVDRSTRFIPTWVKVAVAMALGLGTMVGWKRIVVTVGEKIGKEHLTYAQGAAAEITAMATIGAADGFGLPVSTTHVLSSGIAGTMAANRSGIQLSTVRNLALAWVLTLPVAMVLSGSLFWLFRKIF